MNFGPIVLLFAFEEGPYNVKLIRRPCGSHAVHSVLMPMMHMKHAIYIFMLWYDCVLITAIRKFNIVVETDSLGTISLSVYYTTIQTIQISVAYPGGFSGCPETPQPTMIFFIQGVTSLLAPTLTSHLHLRLLETPLDTNSGYATGFPKTITTLK